MIKNSTNLINLIKKEPPIFIYKGMTLTLKLLPLGRDSTKMSFLPAIRPPVIRIQIFTPHARLHVEQYMQIYYRIHSVKSP